MPLSKKKKELIYHLITGLVLVLKGFDKLTHHHPFIGALILFFGLIIVGYFFYELKSTAHSKILKLLVHFFEGCVLLFTAILFFKEGKTYLPYVTLAASLGFFIATFVMLFKAEEKKI